MNALLSLGRWLFAIPFAIFGLLHLMNAQGMADFVVPSYMPAKAIWVYLSGAGMIAAAVAMVTGKMDKLATVLLGIFMLLLVLMVHLPAAMNPLTQQNGMAALLKDMALAGAAFMYAKYQAKDRSVIG